MTIAGEVAKAVVPWKTSAQARGISQQEIEQLASALQGVARKRTSELRCRLRPPPEWRSEPKGRNRSEANSSKRAKKTKQAARAARGVSNWRAAPHAQRDNVDP
jgi:hypothetical protein